MSIKVVTDPHWVLVEDEVEGELIKQECSSLAKAEEAARQNVQNRFENIYIVKPVKALKHSYTFEDI